MFIFYYILIFLLTLYKIIIMLRKFIEETPALVSIIILPVILWSIIFVIEYLIGYFMSPIMVGAVSAISGVVIGSYINHVKNS